MSCRPKLGNFEALVFSYEFFAHNYQNLCHYVCRLDSSYVHTIVPWCPWLPHCLTLYHFGMGRVYPCTLPRLVLTFAIMSRWTTLNLRRLMWKPELS
jgi:hypothetical protein